MPDPGKLSKLVLKTFGFILRQDAEWCQIRFPTGLVLSIPYDTDLVADIVLLLFFLKYLLRVSFFTSLSCLSFFLAATSFQTGLFVMRGYLNHWSWTWTGFTHGQFSNGFLVIIEIGYEHLLYRSCPGAVLGLLYQWWLLQACSVPVLEATTVLLWHLCPICDTTAYWEFWDRLTSSQISCSTSIWVYGWKVKKKIPTIFISVISALKPVDELFVNW